jgi:hypothetical protein
MNYIFFQMAAINGFDSIGHYLRADLLVNVCSTYVTTQQAGCTATFTPRKSIQSSAASASAASTASAHAKPVRLRAQPVAPAAPVQHQVQAQVATQGQQALLGSLMGNG